MSDTDERMVPAMRPRTALDAFPGPEQPDAAPEPALLFMSWRAALANVHGRIEDAYSLRRVWFQHAFDAGFTCAQIGEATGLSAAAVHKIIGTQRKRDLDSPVSGRAAATPEWPEDARRPWPIAPDTVMPPRRQPVRWGSRADDPPTDIHDDPQRTKAYLAGLAAGRTEARAASPDERLREALRKIDALVLKWDAPLRHKADDEEAHVRWAEVGSEAYKIAHAALAAADREENTDA